MLPVADARRVAPGVFSIRLRAPALARRVRPGQFVNLKVGPGPDPLLRRPVSICDVEGDVVRLLVRVVGRGTAALSRMRRGDEMDALGPLGKPAPAVRGQDLFIVGGGIGAAPLLLLARRLGRQNRTRVFLGARARSQLLLRTEFRALGLRPELATDDGSAGFAGVVSELVEPAVKSAPRAVVMACGPLAMLRDLVRRLDPIPVWGFIEERMGCGTGICYCCALPKKGGGYVRFCADGPVVLLNEAVP